TAHVRRHRTRRRCRAAGVVGDPVARRVGDLPVPLATDADPSWDESVAACPPGAAALPAPTQAGAAGTAPARDAPARDAPAGGSAARPTSGCDSSLRADVP